jgi:hypothetical protein
MDISYIKNLESKIEMLIEDNKLLYTLLSDSIRRLEKLENSLGTGATGITEYQPSYDLDDLCRTPEKKTSTEKVSSAAAPVPGTVEFLECCLC